MFKTHSQYDEEYSKGVELVSPLVSRADGGIAVGGGSESRHPGWGFGYNGPDPRVRFKPHASAGFGDSGGVDIRGALWIGGGGIRGGGGGMLGFAYYCYYFFIRV